MVTVNVIVPKMSFPDYDYFFEKEKDFQDMLPKLTPKFKGRWEIILYEPSITLAREMLNVDPTPSFVHCMLYVSSKKYDALTLINPDLENSRKSVYELYQDMVLQLKHTMSPKVAHMIYNAVGGDLERLQEALNKLDVLCEGSAITEKLVQKHYVVQEKVYASQVFRAFVTNDRRRWKYFETFHKELGTKSAFYAMRNYTKQLLVAKDDYLHNKEVKLLDAKRIDAASIDFAYLLFNDIDDYRLLPALMIEFEKRSPQVVERVLEHVNLQ